MCNGISLETTIKELEDMKIELRKMEEYRKANMLDFATGYLNKYLSDIRNREENSKWIIGVDLAKNYNED